MRDLFLITKCHLPRQVGWFFDDFRDSAILKILWDLIHRYFQNHFDFSWSSTTKHFWQSFPVDSATFRFKLIPKPPDDSFGVTWLVIFVDFPEIQWLFRVYDLKYYVREEPIRSGTQYLDFEEYMSLHSTWHHHSSVWAAWKCQKQTLRSLLVLVSTHYDYQTPSPPSGVGIG